MFFQIHAVKNCLYNPILMSSMAASDILKDGSNWDPIKKNFFWIICGAILCQRLVGIT